MNPKPLQKLPHNFREGSGDLRSLSLASAIRAKRPSMLPPVQFQPNSKNRVAARPRQSSSAAPAQALLTFLNFEDLPTFELVRTQYEQFGIQFENSIVLEPSNPAFPSQRGARVLMPIAGQSTLVLRFKQPIQRIGAWVTGFQAVTLRVFDTDDHLLGHVSTGRPTYLVPSSHEIKRLPDQLLQLQTSTIAKAVLQADAPFTVESLFFGNA
jgi:hypothetical protein